MKKMLLLFFGILCISLHAEHHTNPFTSYNKQIEFIEKQLADAEEKQKPDIQKRLDYVKKQRAEAVAKRKQPHLRKIRDLEKFLTMAKSNSKKSSLKRRIKREQDEINRLDAYARGASKYDVDKATIEDLKNAEKKDAKTKKEKQQETKSKTVVD